MYVACSTLCFSKYPLERALGSIHELRFAKVDLTIGAENPHVRTAALVNDTPQIAALLRATNLSFAAFHLDLNGQSAEADREAIRATCRLGRMLTVPIVSLSAAPLGGDFAAECKRLQCYARIAAGEGITLALCTERHTMTADPLGALEFCKRVPGLGLTLDPSHYLAGPHRREEFDDLYPFVRHVRLRDSKGDQLQVRVGQGEIEYSSIIHSLERYRYERALTVDIRDTVEFDGPMEPEVRKLKFLLESML